MGLPRGISNTPKEHRLYKALEAHGDERPQVEVMGTSDEGLGGDANLTFRANRHTPYVYVHVQSTKTTGGDPPTSEEVRKGFLGLGRASGHLMQQVDGDVDSPDRKAMMGVYPGGRNEGGEGYDASNFTSSTRYNTVSQKQHEVTITRDDDEHYYAYRLR